MKTLLKRLAQGIIALVVLGLLAALALAAARPWYTRWGATDAEVAAILPGDEFVASSASTSTLALTIQAAPEQVFPWLVQMGADKGGLYSHTFIEGLLNCPVVNADRIHPQWQALNVGDPVKMCPGDFGPRPYTIAAMEASRYLIWGHSEADGSWHDVYQFVLQPAEDGATRLVFRSRTISTSAVDSLLEPGFFIMQSGMLQGIKERAETAAPLTAAPAPAPTLEPAPTVPPRPFSAVRLDAAALAQNLIDEPTERTIYVYLPPSYAASSGRYPVVYYLPGFSDGGMLGFYLPGDMDALIKDSAVQEMILVVVPGVNSVGGSFYVNSPVTGNWEDFVVEEVVGYVDSHYRTLAQARSRGLSGHSMGGFGALNIAMHHPEVFGAVYSMSPGLFDENGLAESQMFAAAGSSQAFIDAQRDILAQPADQAKYAVMQLDQFTVAYGYAFAPDPGQPPFYFDYPFAEVNGKLARDDSVWARWESGFGGIADEIQQYKANLMSLRGLAVDYGQYDGYQWIPKGCQYLDAQLTAAGILHTVESYPGGHGDQLGARIRDHLLPFFSDLLERE